MSEDKKEVVVAAKEVAAPSKKTENALKEIAAPKKHLTDEEVWVRIYCAAVSGDVRATALAKGIANAGLAEFKAQFAAK